MLISVYKLDFLTDFLYWNFISFEVHNSCDAVFIEKTVPSSLDLLFLFADSRLESKKQTLFS